MITTKFPTILALSIWAFSVNAQKQYASCSVDGKLYGYIDAEGKEVIKQAYTHPTDVSSAGVLCLRDPASKSRKLMKIDGTEIPTEFKSFDVVDIMGFSEKGFIDDHIRVIVGGKIGIVDKTGKTIHQPEYDKITDIFGDLAFGGKGTTWYVLNLDGTKIEIASPVKEVKKLKDGLAPYVLPDGKHGFVSAKGEVVVPAIYESVGYFSCGLAWVRTADKKIGFIDKTGKVVIEPKYDKVREFDELAQSAVAQLGTQFFIVDKTGKEITVEGANVIKDFFEGIAEAKKGDKWGYINKDGKWIVEPIYEKNDKFVNGFARVYSAGQWGFVDKNGKVVIAPSYNKVDHFSEGFAAVRAQEKGKWGFINAKGEELVAPTYDDTKPFTNGFARIKLGNKWGAINAKGELVIPINYVKLNDFTAK